MDDLIGLLLLFALLAAPGILIGIIMSVIDRRRGPPPLPAEAPGEEADRERLHLWQGRSDWMRGRLEHGVQPRGGAVAALLMISMILLPVVIGVIVARVNDDPRFLHGGAVLGMVMLLMAGLVQLDGDLRAGRKFGISKLVLAQSPLFLGERLQGEVHTGVSAESSPADGFKLQLRCVHEWRSGKSSLRRHVLWQTELGHSGRPSAERDGRLAVPVDLELPAGPRETVCGRRNYVRWELALHASLPGLDYRSCFELPVFRRGCTWPAVPAAEKASAGARKPGDPAAVGSSPPGPAGVKAQAPIPRAPRAPAVAGRRAPSPAPASAGRAAAGEPLDESGRKRRELWRRRRDWVAGRIAPDDRSASLGACLVLAFLFLSPAAAVGVGGWVSEAPTFLWAGIALGTLTLLWLGWGALGELRLRKFGDSHLLLARNPPFLGERLQGVVETGVSSKAAPAEGFSLQLQCVNAYTSQVRGSKSRSETVYHRDLLWEVEARARGTPSARVPGQLAVQVDFELPASLPETTAIGSGGIVWVLGIQASLPGLDYQASFELPVFVPDEGSWQGRNPRARP